MHRSKQHLYSITSLALARSDGGTLIAMGVEKLIRNSA